MTSIPTPKLATADVCDAKGAGAVVVPAPFYDYGGRYDFAGPAVTIKTLEDNLTLKKLAATPGEGRVIVVDGGGSLRAALLGGNIAADAAANGWAGVVINGAVRDLHEIGVVDIGIKALGSCPRKSNQKGAGELNSDVAISGVVVRSGDWIIADADGVVVCSELPSL